VFQLELESNRLHNFVNGKRSDTPVHQFQLFIAQEKWPNGAVMGFDFGEGGDSGAEAVETSWNAGVGKWSWSSINSCKYFAIALGSTMGSKVTVIGKNRVEERIEAEEQGSCLRLYLPGVNCGLIYSHINLLSTKL